MKEYTFETLYGAIDKLSKGTSYASRMQVQHVTVETISPSDINILISFVEDDIIRISATIYNQDIIPDYITCIIEFSKFKAVSVSAYNSTERFSMSCIPLGYEIGKCFLREWDEIKTQERVRYLLITMTDEIIKRFEDLWEVNDDDFDLNYFGE